MRSVFSVALVFVLLVNPLSAQDDAIRRLLRDRLYARMSGEIVAPLSVIRELSYQNAKNADFRDLHDIAMQKSTYVQLQGAEAYIKRVQADVFILRQQVIEQSLQQVSPSPTLVSLVSLTSNRSFADLQQDLQRAAAVDLGSLSAIQKRLKPLQVGAIQTIVDSTKRTQAVATAQRASEQIEKILSKRLLQQADINDLKRQGEAIVGTFNDKARMVLGSVPDKDALIRVYYQNLSNLSTGISQQIATVIPAAQLPKLTSQQSIDLLQSLGAIGNTHASLVHVLDKDADGRDFADRLADGVKQLGSQWDQMPKNLSKIDPPTQAFITGFRGLVGNLHGDQAIDVPALASTLSAVGVFPRGSAVAQASGAISELMARKGDYANAASGLVATLSVLNKAGVNIPGIGQVAPLLSAANSIFKAAGPLTTIAGFATGLGAFSMIGGLGGLTGGSDDAVNQALAQINARLEVIEHKLDDVLRDLKNLDDKITKYHAEEMHALEGITFEVVRSNQLITMTLHDKVGTPCKRAADPTDPDQQNQLNFCMNSLADAYAGAPPLREPPKALSFELNVQDYNKENPLEQTALDRWRAEVAFRDNLTAIVGKANCEGLVYPSADLDSLMAKYAEYAGGPQAANCSGILKTNLVEPGITTQYVNWEQNALAASSRLPRADALKWWQKNWAFLRIRWMQKELPLLNSAIAQQAGVSGDVLIPPLSKKLDDALTDDTALAALKKVWNVNGLLAENITRHWIWSRMKPASAAGGASSPTSTKARWLRSLYAFAWESGDETYWRAVTNLPADSPVKFTMVVRPPENGGGWVWTVKFRDLDPVPLPEPSEMNLLQLRWPSSLSDLVEVRAKVIEALTGADYVQQTWKNKPEAAKDLLEAFATATPKERLSGK